MARKECFEFAYLKRSVSNFRHFIKTNRKAEVASIFFLPEQHFPNSPGFKEKDSAILVQSMKISSGISFSCLRRLDGVHV